MGNGWKMQTFHLKQITFYSILKMYGITFIRKINRYFWYSTLFLFSTTIIICLWKWSYPIKMGPTFQEKSHFSPLKSIIFSYSVEHVSIFYEMTSLKSVPHPCKMLMINSFRANAPLQMSYKEPSFIIQSVNLITFTVVSQWKISLLALLIIESQSK